MTLLEHVAAYITSRWPDAALHRPAPFDRLIVTIDRRIFEVSNRSRDGEVSFAVTAIPPPDMENAEPAGPVVCRTHEEVEAALQASPYALDPPRPRTSAQSALIKRAIGEVAGAGTRINEAKRLLASGKRDDGHALLADIERGLGDVGRCLFELFPQLLSGEDAEPVRIAADCEMLRAEAHAVWSNSSERFS